MIDKVIVNNDIFVNNIINNFIKNNNINGINDLSVKL